MIKATALLAFIFCTSTLRAQQYTISTIAGCYSC